MTETEAKELKIKADRLLKTVTKIVAFPENFSPMVLAMARDQYEVTQALLLIVEGYLAEPIGPQRYLEE